MKITRVMIEAGASLIEDYRDLLTSYALAEDVYIAMQKASKGPEKTTGKMMIGGTLVLTKGEP